MNICLRTMYNEYLQLIVEDIIILIHVHYNSNILLNDNTF